MPRISPLRRVNEIVDALALRVVGVVAGDVARLEHHFADGVLRAADTAGHFAAHHLRDDALDIHLRHRRGGDMLAVADDDDGVANGRHFIELVRNVDAGDALAFSAQMSSSTAISDAVSDDEGSSRISRRAFLLSALAISTSCWWPPPYCDRQRHVDVGCSVRAAVPRRGGSWPRSHARPAA
jgi:hypothetical protein